MTKPAILASAAFGVACTAAPLHAADDLATGFINPPAAAKPWVYWFWMDGNLSREGITADLEAMQRVGIGGVIIMEVDVGIPRGPVKFMSPPWRELFWHVASEAARLGIEIDMNAGPGWTGSGGPWIRPEQSMQKVVWTETSLEGPKHFDGPLPQPQAVADFHRDIAVLAFPTPAGDYRITDILEKALYHRGHFSSERGVPSFIPAPAQHPALPPEQTIGRDRILDLTTQLDATGRLTWDVPPGRWTVFRFGRTSTGANTRPAPAPGLGLECDKLDKTALEAHFNAFVGTLMADIGPLTGKSLASLHIDSWEMGPQNWTAKFREEFQRLRGYDPLRYLPVMTGLVVDNLEISERFLWDLRQTVSELIAENYSGHLHTLAGRHGMRLSIQPYDGTPCDDMTYCGRADVPMCEFWANCFDTFFSCTEAASVAHTYGRRILAAEAFTSDDNERWLLHPATMKPLGDWAFCEGVNRLVFHRYAHQPWLDRRPGMTMGPYGVHYERTQTWWEQSTAWHRYLSRCQFMLQQGLPVADICFLAPQGAPHVFRPPASAVAGNPPDRPGHNFDGCTPEVLLTRMSANDGLLVLPDGMGYRLLVLPQIYTITPHLLRKVKELLEAGATVLGPRPLKSPSLSDYPNCDEQVTTLAAELWGPEPPSGQLVQRSCGKGRLFWAPGMADKSVPPRPLKSRLYQAKWIWHKEGNPAAAAPVGKRYFRRVVTVEPNRDVDSARIVMTADNSFELWVNGRPAGAGDNFTRAYVMDVAPLLKPGVNVLAVAAENATNAPNPAGLIGLLTIRFRSGDVLEFPTDRQWQTAVTAKDNWSSETTVAEAWPAAMELGPYGMAPWHDIDKPLPPSDVFPDFSLISEVLAAMNVPPDFQADRRLRYTHRRDGGTDVYFVANGQNTWVTANCTFRVSGKAPELWDPLTGRIGRQPRYEEKDGRITLPIKLEPVGSLFVVFRKPTTSADTTPDFAPFAEAETAPVLPDLAGPWEVRFQSNCGAPERIILDRLIDLSKHVDPGVKYFSGTATYVNSFNVPPEMLGRTTRLYLDLGEVEVMAQVRLNGKELGILWKTPFRTDVTEAVKVGANALEVAVVNLWPNRLIGDQTVPADKRITRTTWNPFRKDSPLPPSGLIGPVTLHATIR